MDLKGAITMSRVTTEKALKNELASIRMEGYRFSDKELDNVKKCLSGELTFKQFTDKIVRDSRKK